MSLGLEFTKINETKYILSEATELYLKAKEVLKDISNNTVEEYEDNINLQLLDSIICRLASSELLQNVKLSSTELNFLTLDINLPDRTLIIKVGVTNLNNQQKKLDGVLYV